MAEPNVAPSLNANNTLGAILVGGLVAVAFWGITSTQTSIYYSRYPKDRPALKLMVAFLWILDTCDACLTSHILYTYLVTTYMNTQALQKPIWTVFLHIVVTCITNAIIRSMFAWRIWKLSNRNVILMSLVGTITLCDLVVGIIITIRAFELKAFEQINTFSYLFFLSFAAGMLGDFFVALIFCYYLFTSGTGFRSSDTLVRTLIAYIIATGFLAAVNATMGTMFYATMPNNLIFIGFYFNFAKMYINSYLALLNTRQHIRRRNSRPLSLQLSGVSNSPYISDFNPDLLPTLRSDKLQVYVQTTVDRGLERDNPPITNVLPTAPGENGSTKR